MHLTNKMEGVFWFMVGLIVGIMISALVWHGV